MYEVYRLELETIFYFLRKNLVVSSHSVGFTSAKGKPLKMYAVNLYVMNITCRTCKEILSERIEHPDSCPERSNQHACICRSKVGIPERCILCACCNEILHKLCVNEFIHFVYYNCWGMLRSNYQTITFRQIASACV
jgi:hypothetical protein